MSLAVLAIICLTTQALVVSTVYYFLTSTTRRHNLVRGIGIVLFAGLESAIFLHIIIAQKGRAVETRDVLIDIALAALIALAFGFGNSLLNLLHRSRRSLERSESLSSTLFEQSSEPVIILDKSGNLLEINNAACEQLGFLKNELCKLRMSDIVHPDELPTVVEQLTRMVPGDIARTSVRVRRKDGSWMQTDAASRRLDDGTFLTIARDITAQTKQQRSLERFAEVSSGTGDQFFSSAAQNLAESLELEHVLIGELLPGRTDRAKTLALILDGKLAANIEYDLAGTPCNTIVGRTMACYPSDLQKVFPDDAMLVDIGAVSYIGIPLFASNGAPLGIICALSRKAIVNQSHCQTVLACYSHRVESEIERLRTEAALRESEERYSNVVNVSPFGMHMYRLEADGKLILEAANPAADWLLSADHSKLISKTIEEAFPSLANTEVPEQYRRIAAHGERWRSESVTYKDNRIEGAFEVVAFQRSPMKMAAVFMSITDRKQAEEVLRDSETGLANAQRITHIGNWSVDPLKKKSVWSAEMFRICGLSPREKPPWFDEYIDCIVHPDDRQSVRAAIEELTKGRVHQPFDYRIARPDGSIRICRAQSTVEFGSTGQPVRISGTTQDITERKLAEEKLQLTSDRLSLATQGARVGIWDYDIPTQSMFWDPVMYDLYGLSPELTTDPTELWQAAVHPDDLVQTNAKVQELMLIGGQLVADFRIVWPDSSIRHISVNAVIHCDAAGKPARIVGTNWDITERKQAEELLRRQNDFLIALRESTLDLVSESDLDRLLESIVRRAGQLIGTSSGFIDLLEPGADHLIPRIALGCMANDSLKYAVHKGEGITGKAWEAVLPVVVDDYDAWPGRIPGCETNVVGASVATPLVAKSGVVGVLGLAFERGSTRTFDAESVERLNAFARFAALAVETAQLNEAVRRELAEREKEIEVRKRVETKLQRSLSLVRATLESTTDGILVVDYHGNVAGYNQKFLEHWRIPVTLAEQNDDARLITYVLDQLKDPDGFVRKVQELYANPLEESFDLLEFKDGRYFERYSLPQRMGDEIIGRVWSFRDVTERKRAEVERTRLEEQLRLSQKLETIGTLAAGIAHDFNNLLVPVIGYTELADSELASEDPRHEHLAEVLKAAYRAKSLVGQILAFSRQQSGEGKLVRLESVVNETARLLRSSLEPNIIIETSAEANLPQLFADATQLHQVIMNLGVNASHAMKKGGKLTISVKATSGDAANCSVCGCQLFGKHLELCVIDTGHGMDQATLRRIFDPFFTTKPVGEGTGLGLAVTHGIVAHHGGHICARSEVGVGTTFYIYLPAVEDCEHGASRTSTERILAATQITVS